jgi:hypothetical protein
MRGGGKKKKKKKFNILQQYEIFHDLCTNGHDLSRGVFTESLTKPLTVGSRPTSQQGIKTLVGTY